ncbi:hypothetical protein PO883_02730 [Massilia sp. DJPM01]|uniref:hypothetical protein n=1 Tax=Massilia sp. DJPM01 TaxID=3024404 RepID=UPI00259F3D19|nr:hypothetical protein [Massilia sp. DJPM01]MDM5176109.1 hypothetical protein [Massilia sp. DJPM01]
MEEKIRLFIEQTFLFEFGDDITSTTDLFKAGVIDSFGYVQLMHFLESEFAFKYSDDEFLTQILVSLDSLVDSVREKMEANAAA